MGNQSDIEQFTYLVLLILCFAIISYIRDTIHQRRYRKDPFYRRKVREESRTVIG